MNISSHKEAWKNHSMLEMDSDFTQIAKIILHTESRIAIFIDLEKAFNCVNHDILQEIRVIRVIWKLKVNY